MATDIFDRGFSDHVVFDRIVDVDRTITLARQAADEAEKRGQPEKAAKLREKADYLEEILNNTQNPDYSDEEEGTPPEQSNGGEGAGKGKDSGQGKKSDTSNNDTGEGEEEKDSKEPDTTGNGSGGEENKEKGEGEGEGSDSGSGAAKQPEDIANLDQSNGKHASGTNQHQGGGPSGNSQGNGGSSNSQSSGGSQGNQGNQGNQGSGTNNPQNQGQGQGKGQGQNQELDPFRVSSSRQQGNQKQPTKEEILAAIIKKLSSLSGEAKKGADRALQDYFNNVSGGGTL